MVRPFSRKAKEKAPVDSEDEVIEEVVGEVKEIGEEPVDMMGQPSDGVQNEIVPFEETDATWLLELYKASGKIWLAPSW